VRNRGSIPGRSKKLAQVSKPAAGAIQPRIQWMPKALSQGENPIRSLDSRCHLLLPLVRKDGAIIHSAICLHCVYKHNAFNSISTKECHGSSVSIV